MKNKCKVIVTHFAEEDLLEIIDYYHGINEEYAAKLLLQIEHKINELKENPKLGRIIPELEKHDIIKYRELIEGNYRIMYSVHEDFVIIHTILDARRNIEEILISKLMRSY